MLLKKVAVLLCAALVCLSGGVCFAEGETSPVSVNNETRVVTLDLATIQYPGTVISVNVWQPGCSAQDLAQGKKLQELSAYIGETSVVKTEEGNKIQTNFTLKPQADSGTYTISLLIPGETQPRQYTFPFSNLAKARRVLSIAQDSASTQEEIMAALDGGIIDVDVAAAEAYLAYGAGDVRRAFVAGEIKKDRPQSTGDPAADMNDFIAKLQLQNKKIALTKRLAEAERGEMKTLLEENSELFLVQDKMADYNTLTETEKEKLYGIFSVTITDCIFPEDVKKAFYAAYEEAVKKPTPSANSKPENQGGGGGGGGKSVSVPTEKLTQTNEHNQAPDSRFSDIESVEWAKTAITVLAECGVVNGKTEQAFCPGDRITREEFVKMLVNAFKLEPASASALPFADVQHEDWFYKPIHAAYQYKIINGISETAFGIGSPITRQDMAVMLYQTMAAKGIVLEENAATEFADGSSIAGYAQTAVAALSGGGIISGREDNTFAPQATATRAEAAKMLYEAMYRFNYLYV